MEHLKMYKIIVITANTTDLIMKFSSLFSFIVNTSKSSPASVSGNVKY